jgi:hypothetical protein
MTTAEVTEPSLARPWAPHRARIYVATGLFAGTIFTLMTVAVATGWRCANGNPWTFGPEVISVITGVVIFVAWTRLIRPDLPAKARIRHLWLAFAGCAVQMSTTAVYVVSEVGVGFSDIGQGGFGLWFKFLAEIFPFIVLPPLVLYAIHLQIDYLTRRSGARDALADNNAIY